jgi:hypothetical protein
MSQGVSRDELLRLNDIRGAVATAALQRLGFSVDNPPDRDIWEWDWFISEETKVFYQKVFLQTRDDRLRGEDEDMPGPLATHPEAFKYFKERITEVTGVEL